jgi:two-component system chemotaxis response regulator CheY
VGSEVNVCIMKILVVEDDYISRRLLCRYLEPYGKCEEAVNGKEAVAAVRLALDAGEHYDLICLDIMMPGLDGQQALEIIRRLETEHEIQIGRGAKVIMTSAMEDNQNIMQAFMASADGYVVKPIERLKFVATMEEIGLVLQPQESGDSR